MCVCLNARSLVNKKNELNIMVQNIDLYIIGLTESWANKDISDAELGLTGYIMFRRDRRGRRGGGVILYIKESILAYKIKLEKPIAMKLFGAIYYIDTGNSTLPVGLCTANLHRMIIIIIYHYSLLDASTKFIGVTF